nr:MAG TPA: hypothetical protein [Caudoviricetes sp.]
MIAEKEDICGSVNNCHRGTFNLSAILFRVSSDGFVLLFMRLLIVFFESPTIDEMTVEISVFLTISLLLVC